MREWRLQGRDGGFIYLVSVLHQRALKAYSLGILGPKLQQPQSYSLFVIYPINI